VIIANSPAIFNTIKYLGAFYLIYIGIQSGRAGVLVPSQSIDHIDSLKETGSRKSLLQSFRQGFIANILKTKVLILYMTIIPQFVMNKGQTTQRENKQ